MTIVDSGERISHRSWLTWQVSAVRKDAETTIVGGISASRACR